jgi:predicted TIM-barrel fold metal-dependent hydrolase
MHRRIDIHHHFFPSSLDKKKKNLQVGWRTPPENLPWTPEISLKFMDAYGIDMAILSLPPSSSGGVKGENRAIARNHNTFAANICKKYPTRFGFFATMPFLDDTEGE